MVGKIKEYLPEKEFIKVHVVIWSAKKVFIFPVSIVK